MRSLFFVSLKQPQAQQNKVVHPGTASYFWSLDKYIWLWLESRMAEEGIFAEGWHLCRGMPSNIYQECLQGIPISLVQSCVCRKFLFYLLRIVFLKLSIVKLTGWNQRQFLQGPCRHIHVVVKVDYILLLSLGLVRLFGNLVFINAFIMDNERQMKFG